MKKLIATTLLLITTQASLAHPDCVFHAAPVGSGHSSKQKKADSAVVNATIAAKEKLDELINLFNVFSSKNIRVLAALSQVSTIEKPLQYSAQTIAKELNDLQATMSPELKKALFTDGKPNLSKISESDLKNYGSKIAGLYELAIRYDLLIQRKSAYIEASTRDVRGFYYLYSKGIDENKLNQFNQFSSAEQEKIKSALIGTCRNSKIKASACAKELKTNIQNNSVSAFYTKYRNSSVINWNSFFQIPESAVRNDVTIRNNVLEIPFKMQKNNQMHDFAKSIESRWKLAGLEVSLDFKDEKNIPNIVLKDNSVAHVNKLGGNDIIMNTSLDFQSFTSQRTLSHEFGHVLGLPDCYIEFYDEEEEAFVNYQLFKDDMMCSSNGKLTPRIIAELKKVYGSK